MCVCENSGQLTDRGRFMKKKSESTLLKVLCFMRTKISSYIRMHDQHGGGGIKYKASPFLVNESWRMIEFDVC